MEAIVSVAGLVAIAVASYWGARLGTRPLSAKKADEINAITALRAAVDALVASGAVVDHRAIQAATKDPKQAQEMADAIRRQAEMRLDAKRELEDAVNLYREAAWSADLVRKLDKVLQHEFDRAGIEYPGAAELCPEAVPIMDDADQP